MKYKVKNASATCLCGRLRCKSHVGAGSSNASGSSACKAVPPLRHYPGTMLKTGRGKKIHGLHYQKRRNWPARPFIPCLPASRAPCCHLLCGARGQPHPAARCERDGRGKAAGSIPTPKETSPSSLRAIWARFVPQLSITKGGGKLKAVPQPASQQHLEIAVLSPPVKGAGYQNNAPVPILPSGCSPKNPACAKKKV